MDFSKTVLNIGAGFDTMPFVHHSQIFAEQNEWARDLTPPSAFIYVDILFYARDYESDLANHISKKLAFKDALTEIAVTDFSERPISSQQALEHSMRRRSHHGPIRSFQFKVRLLHKPTGRDEFFDLLYIRGSNDMVIQELILPDDKINITHFRARRDRGNPRIFRHFCQNASSYLEQGFQPETLFTDQGIENLQETHDIRVAAGSRRLKSEYGTPCTWFKVEKWNSQTPMNSCNLKSKLVHTLVEFY